MVCNNPSIRYFGDHGEGVGNSEWSAIFPPGPHGTRFLPQHQQCNDRSHCPTSTDLPRHWSRSNSCFSKRRKEQGVAFRLAGRSTRRRQHCGGRRTCISGTVFNQFNRRCRLNIVIAARCRPLPPAIPPALKPLLDIESRVFAGGTGGARGAFQIKKELVEVGGAPCPTSAAGAPCAPCNPCKAALHP